MTRTRYIITETTHDRSGIRRTRNLCTLRWRWLARFNLWLLMYTQSAERLHNYEWRIIKDNISG